MPALFVTSRLVAYWLKHQPSYQGHPVSHWLKGLSSTNYLVREQAFEAIVQLGPESVLTSPRSENSPLAVWKDLFSASPDQASLKRDISAEVRLQIRAAEALVEIGPPAVLALFELFKNDDQISHLAAVGVLRASVRPF